MLADSWPPPQVPFTRRIFPFVLVGLVVVPVVALGIYFAVTHSAHLSQIASGYPYPECQEIVAWLQNNVYDRDGLEIVQWESRVERAMNNPTRPNGGRSVEIIVRYRAKNAFGAKVLNGASFWFYDGKFGDVIHR